MYNASSDFHNAIKNGNPQMALLIFGENAVFTSEDINISKGIEFDDLFCTEDNISIGQALMNNIRFTLFNDNQLLNDYEFGKFQAFLGVQTSEETYTQEGTISVTFGNNTYVAYATSPYITRNGTALAEQPSGKIANIIIYKELVYCFLESGNLVIYDDATGNRIYNIGNNVFDSSSVQFVTGYYIDATGAISELSRYRYTDTYIKVKPNTTYYVYSYKETTQNAGFTVPLYDKNKDFIVRQVAISASSVSGDVYGTFTTTGATEYIRFSCGTRFTTSEIVITENVPRFMADKFKQKTYYGAYFRTRYTYNMSGRIAHHWAYINCNGVSKKYEFVPLGTFIADRPDAPSVKEINFSCNDQMQLFDASMPSDTDLGITYPTTIGTLFTKMCNYLGVPYLVSTFTNSSATISKRPAQFDNATMRTVLQWIAEAAGKNAKFNRDGELVFVWLNTTNQELTESDYSSFTPCWYKTQQVDKLYNRDSQSSVDNTYGSGNGGYLILDNPLMKGAT